MDDHFRVTIYGSARIRPEDETHQLVHDLAKRIAAEGMDIVTGGGPGLMDAAARGHYNGRGEKAVQSVGLRIALPTEESDSYHLDIKRHFDRFSQRLDTFVSLSNVVVVAPGGIGTLLELFYTWQLIQVKHSSATPIILLGSMWRGLLDWIRANGLRKALLDEADLAYLYCVDSAEEAMAVIRATREAYLQGGRAQQYTA